jgi:serine/threonine protein kinase/tetratricopeptide (TPR) repeat protein
MNEPERQIMSIFGEAVEHSSPEERAAFLAKACAGGAGRRARVEALLRAYEAAGNFLQGNPPPSEAVATVDQPPVAEGAGTVIGPYKLLEQIGEGGFGVVFMAEQQEPIRRKVALKVLKPGMDSKQVIARFEAERQALALMDHPHIAKVLDAGQTDSGRPYFVMDLVKGLPITDFCDQSQLTAKERLELFVHVCQAVQHAHQKGVIHRDIKPSNVLVTLQDGTPLVKVIDFGIAKALGQQLTDKTLFTGFAQLIGTPLYMAPEQAAFSNVDVDTRSDIYSLGVLLYELLTGTTPFTKERLQEAGYDEMRRIIREEEPPRPSTRLSTMGQEAATVSTQRRSDPKRLSQLFRGELDWIVMKALEKDRNRRYETANGFAMDVQRYLHDEPVLACPPSGWYRFRKFARRNKRALAVAGMVLFFIALLGAGIGWVAQDRAVRQGETERGVTAAIAQAKTLLAEGDKQIDHPERWQATTRLALVALEKAEELLAAGAPTEELAGQVRQVRAAVEAAATHSDLLVQLDRIRLAQTATKDGQYDMARAAPMYAAALKGYGVNLDAPEEAAARVRGSRLKDRLLITLYEWRAVTKDMKEWQRLGEVLRAAEAANGFWGQWLTAASHRDRAALVRLAERVDVGKLQPRALNAMALDLRNVKELVAAERLLRAGQQRYPSDFWLNHDLGMALLNQKPRRAEDAARYLTAAVALRNDSPGVYLNLGKALAFKRDLDEAIRCFQAALRIDPKYAQARGSIGAALADKGDREGAIREYKAALKLDPKDATAHYNLGLSLKIKGDRKGAIQCYRAAIRFAPRFALAHNNLGLALYENDDLDEAIRELRLALKIDGDLAIAHFNLGLALAAKGEWEKAIPEVRSGLRLAPNNAKAHALLGQGLLTQGEFGKARAGTAEALKLFRPDDPNRSRVTQLMRRCEELIALDVKLRAVLGGEKKPEGPDEMVGLAWLCQQPYKQLYAAAARFYGAAFTLEPRLAEDLRSQHRYNAACAAALAGCGQGKDAKKLNDPERAGLRKRALDWLQADLAQYAKEMEHGPAQVRPAVSNRLEHWQRDRELMGVRGPKALGKLPHAERQVWKQLWADVEALRKRAAQPD